MTVELSALSVEETMRRRDELADIYCAAFGVMAPNEQRRFSQEMLPRHAGRTGFRLIVATRNGGALVGFVYGYRGAPGQWWHDTIRRVMSERVAAEWMADAFEFTELAVHPNWQGRGIGSRLHDAILADLSEARALLSTAQGDTAAMRLYRKRGWVPLLTDFVYAAGSDPCAIMGLDLRAFRTSGLGCEMN